MNHDKVNRAQIIAAKYNGGISLIKIKQAGQPDAEYTINEDIMSDIREIINLLNNKTAFVQLSDGRDVTEDTLWWLEYYRDEPKPPERIKIETGYIYMPFKDGWNTNIFPLRPKYRSDLTPGEYDLTLLFGEE